jgi:succinate dehydrogenase / fumarate reductase iron-sulfur subunit
MSTHAPAAKSISRTAPKSVEIHIRRRENPDSPQYWEEFEIPYRPNLNIISCLMEIQKNPVNKAGMSTTPPVWQMNCLEQVCGICTMIVNGRVRQSCSALIDQLEQPIKARADVEVSEHSGPCG